MDLSAVKSSVEDLPILWCLPVFWYMIVALVLTIETKRFDCSAWEGPGSILEELQRTGRQHEPPL
jgi:hypothetical protein